MVKCLYLETIPSDYPYIDSPILGSNVRTVCRKSTVYTCKAWPHKDIKIVIEHVSLLPVLESPPACDPYGNNIYVPP